MLCGFEEHECSQRPLAVFSTALYVLNKQIYSDNKFPGSSAEKMQVLAVNGSP